MNRRLIKKSDASCAKLLAWGTFIVAHAPLHLFFDTLERVGKGHQFDLGLVLAHNSIHRSSVCKKEIKKMWNESYSNSSNSMQHSALLSENIHRNDVNKHACSSPIPYPNVQFVRSSVHVARNNRSLLGKLAEENSLVALKGMLMLPLLDHDSFFILDRRDDNKHFRCSLKKEIPSHISNPPLYFQQSLNETSARVA